MMMSGGHRPKPAGAGSAAPPNQGGSGSRAASEDYGKRAHREICGLCHRASPVGFWVPDECWRAVVHASRLHDIHCLACFIERADEQLIAWDREIQLFPISFATHLQNTREPEDMGAVWNLLAREGRTQLQGRR